MEARDMSQNNFNSTLKLKMTKEFYNKQIRENFVMFTLW